MLPDVMIAVFVTVVALVAILSVMAPLLRSEFYNRDEAIATGLAQDGIEFVRNMRDNNWQTCKTNSSPCPRYKTSFEDPFPQVNYGEGPVFCKVDYSTGKVVSAPDSQCSFTNNAFYIDVNGSGLYTTVGATGKFQRIIQIMNTDDVTRYVSSTVSWKVGSKKHEITVYGFLMPWGDS